MLSVGTEYLTASLWNCCDLSCFILYIAFYVIRWKQSFDPNLSELSLMLLLMAILVLAFVKILFLVRI